MPLFEYEAVTLDGVTIKGKLESPDRDKLNLSLREHGYYPTLIREKNSIFSKDIELFAKVSMKDIAIFCRQFAVIIAAGIPIIRALDIVKAQTENTKFKRILDDVMDEVQKGLTLSDAMRKHKEMPDMLCNMISVGESSGTLDNILEKMAKYYEKEAVLRNKIIGAMTYPIAVLVIAVVVVILMITLVVPMFADMLSEAGGTLPAPTQILMNMSDFMKNNWALLIVGVVLLIIALSIFFKTDRGKKVIDFIKLNMPVIGKIQRKMITARFATSFGLLIGSGMPLLSGIEICAEILNNSIVKKSLLEANEEIKKGQGVGESLEGKGLFPTMLTNMIKVGEEAGTLDAVLETTASFYEMEVDTATEQMTNLIQPVIMVFLGGVIAFIMVAVMLPMMNLYDNIG